MTGELYINERDAWAVWGVNMAEGFLDTIDAPLPMKEYIEDESRLEDGIRIDTSNPKVDSREITLGFTITGNSETDYRSKKSAFQSELQKGMKSISYGLSRDRRFGHFTMKCTEPNPADRE